MLLIDTEIVYVAGRRPAISEIVPANTPLPHPYRTANCGKRQCEREQEGCLCDFRADTTDLHRRNGDLSRERRAITGRWAMSPEELHAEIERIEGWDLLGPPVLENSNPANLSYRPPDQQDRLSYRANLMKLLDYVWELLYPEKGGWQQFQPIDDPAGEGGFGRFFRNVSILLDRYRSHPSRVPIKHPAEGFVRAMGRRPPFDAREIPLNNFCEERFSLEELMAMSSNESFGLDCAPRPGEQLSPPTSPPSLHDGPCQEEEGDSGAHLSPPSCVSCKGCIVSSLWQPVGEDKLFCNHNRRCRQVTSAITSYKVTLLTSQDAPSDQTLSEHSLIGTRSGWAGTYLN